MTAPSYGQDKEGPSEPLSRGHGEERSLKLGLEG